MKVENLSQAIDNTVDLLKSAKYRNTREVIRICRKQIAQAYIFEMLSLGETKDTIADGTGLSEKTIRFYRDGDHAPKKKHLVVLEAYCRKVRRKHSA